MGTRFVPVTFGLIEEGKLAASLDDAIKEAVEKLLGHIRKYGPENTRKSKAEVQLKVTLQFDEEEDFSIKGAISAKYPGRPINVTRAIHEVEQTGEEGLFVRASGSDRGTPRQGILSTGDGRPVDPATGRAPPYRDPDAATKIDNLKPGGIKRELDRLDTNEKKGE